MKYMIAWSLDMFLMEEDGDDAMRQLYQVRMPAAITAKTFGVRKIDTDDL